MAKADVIEFLKPWTQSGQDAERLMAKQLEQGLDTIRENRRGLMERIKKAGSKTTLKPIWMEEVSYQTRITGTLTTSTITFSGYLMNEAIAEKSMRAHIKGGTILMRPSDGLQVRVSHTSGDCDYTAFTAVVAAHGNSGSLSNDSSAITWYIVGDSISDYDDEWEPKGLSRTFRSCGTQAWKENYEQPFTRDSIKMENVADESSHQIKELFEAVYNKIARSVISMRPVYSGGVYVTGYETERPTLTGVSAWPDLLYDEYPNTEVYVNASSSGTAEEISPDVLNGVIQGLYKEQADFNTGSWYIACGLVQHQYLSEMYAEDRRFGMVDEKGGYRIATFKSTIGVDLKILADQNLLDSEILILDTSAFSYGDMAKDKPRVLILGQDNTRIHKKMLTGANWGTMVRKPRQKIGKIYGLPSTFV